MSQESSTHPFHGRGTAASSASFLHSKEDLHRKEVLGDVKEEHPENFNEDPKEQEASKGELEAEEERQEEKDASLPQTVEQRPSAINPTLNKQNASMSASALQALYDCFGHPTSSNEAAANDDNDDNGDKNKEADPTDSGYEPSLDDILKLDTSKMKNSASALVSAVPTKRPFKNSVDENDSERKKMKMKEKVLTDDYPKRQFFERLPRVEDNEFAVSKGIQDCFSKNDSVNTKSLHDLIKNSLNGNIPVGPLIHTFKETRKEYKKIVGERGDSPKFLETCDQEEFDLLKTIWGAGIGVKHADDQNKFNGEEKKTMVVGQQMDLTMYPFLKESFQFVNNMNASMPVLMKSIVKMSLSVMGSSKMEELDEKWKRLLVDEIEIYMKGVDLIREQMKLMLDALKK